MQPNYPTQPMMPQFPTQPAYPVQPAYAQPQGPANPYANPYGVAPGAQQAPAVYGGPQQFPAGPATPPPPAGTLDGFFGQPSAGGGAAWKFNGKPIGTSYAGIVARPVTNADVRHQTNNAGQVQTYRDGRPKLVMVVPMQVQPSAEHPEGVATWWVKGQARDELARAMAEAGAPAGAPEAGAAIRVTLVGQRPVPNMNPANQYRVEYIRPSGAAPAPAPAYPVGRPQEEWVPEQAPAAQPMPQPIPQQQVPVAQPMPQPVAVQQAPQQVAEQPAAAPAGFNPEQAALFAKLTGQQTAQAA
ncbi:hypothetical protein C5N14_13730 [Micromonospora sp. MW-13]|uniref:hypothetical protein n=1 Tax=Micromonospora sp. MW-13 TaxID=2094022 RepID=UPI000E431FB9|nr:hypothetical protein [Micromonospora sp. MW-13]RGC68442.1 hypothetical protein C5N14_13730 [Micromonospora sp. MW-13]